MKIIFTFLTFGENIFGGIEHALYNFILGLTKQGVDCLVYTSGTFVKDKKINGIRIFISKYLQKYYTGSDRNIYESYNKNRDSIKKEFTNLFNLEKPDLIISVDHLWGIIPILDLKLPCRKILWNHLFHNRELLKKVVNDDFELFAVSDCVTKKIKTLTNKEVKILPNPIIYEDFQIKRNPRKIIFCNARISVEKRIIDAVKAFSLISGRLKGFELHLCSGGFHFANSSKSMAEILDFLAIQRNIKVVFHSNFKWSEIPNFLSTCSLILLPTGTESFGIAALEAMAAGVPLVTTTAGNLPDLVGNSCQLVPVGNVSKLSDAILCALKKNSDTLIGKKRAESYDYLNVSKKFLKQIEL